MTTPIYTPESTATYIQVHIGDCLQGYRLYVTSAPQDYDGFGTLSLYDSGKADGADRRRYVLAQEQHATWQLHRYRSGMFMAQPSDEIDEATLTSKLFAAIVTAFRQAD